MSTKLVDASTPKERKKEEKKEERGKSSTNRSKTDSIRAARNQKKREKEKGKGKEKNGGFPSTALRKNKTSECSAQTGEGGEKKKKVRKTGSQPSGHAHPNFHGTSQWKRKRRGKKRGKEKGERRRRATAKRG